MPRTASSRTGLEPQPNPPRQFEWLAFYQWVLSTRDNGFHFELLPTVTGREAPGMHVRRELERALRVWFEREEPTFELQINAAIREEQVSESIGKRMHQIRVVCNTLCHDRGINELNSVQRRGLLAQYESVSSHLRNQLECKRKRQWQRVRRGKRSRDRHSCTTST